MNVLIACEESQEVCKAFRELGHNAFSCDLQECSGGFPGWHIMGDCLRLLDGCCTFETMDGERHSIDGKWDLIISHPPCTFLTVTGNRWYDVNKYGQRAVDRFRDRQKAINFFMAFVNADCDRIAIENPVGIMSTFYKKPSQIIQPYYFGDPYEKKTCLWLKGLPKLQAEKIIDPPKRQFYPSGRSMAKWYADSFNLSKKERSKVRSKTFPGIARAMAKQWGGI